MNVTIENQEWEITINEDSLILWNANEAIQRILVNGWADCMDESELYLERQRRESHGLYYISKADIEEAAEIELPEYVKRHFAEAKQEFVFSTN